MYDVLTGKKIYILTLGCKVNQYESDAMYEAFFAAGALRGSENDADICIINTCSVTNIADRKSRQMISRLRKENPDAVIVATGCYVQAVANRALFDRGAGTKKSSGLADRTASRNEGDTSSSSRIPQDGSGTRKPAGDYGKDVIDADLIVGNNRKREMVRLVAEHLLGTPIEDNLIDIAKDPEFEDLRIAMPEHHTRAYLKIQDGCNMFCAYCIIPYVRGRIRNKSLDAIMEETATLAASGVKELVLTGINISSFGDIGDLSLADVICRIHAIPGIERIRLGSLEPRVVTEEFLQRISKLPKVCPHFHLSLQSGCDSILKRMNRHYTVADIDTIVSRLRRYYDRPALTADIIVGFPGESEDEFLTTCRTVERIGLYEAHVFPFSRRKGTVADRMDGQLTEAEKKDRVRRLMEVVSRLKKEYEASFDDEEKKVLIEEIIDTLEGPAYRGHTERYLLVDILPEMIGESLPDPARINTVITLPPDRK
ncbi:MAG: MiaB/RimO family radical SAM methylthiotransferase [Eubacterium sp.]|nr:MiaB/RimO family radical SAM methylthiotransferase [Eubacterium sp.]